MTKSFRIVIPVKPHIRKYIHSLYGLPVTIDKTTLLGNIMLCLLQKKTMAPNINLQKVQGRFLRLTAKIECHAMMYRGEDTGIHITQNHIIVINQMMENMFDDDLYKWMLSNTSRDGRYRGYNKALRSFMESYSIEENVDISFDTLKKAEYRRRKRIKENNRKLLQDFVPGFF